jgi:hypothetical protein
MEFILIFILLKLLLFNNKNYFRMKNLIFVALLLFFSSCSIPGERKVITKDKDSMVPLELTSKPYARYWWFASMIKKEDIRFNLDWLKANGFGGVEIAWVYPLNRFNPKDTTYTPRQEWLSRDWTEIVKYAISYADSIGIGCDLTYGTLWPFGDSYVPFEQATQHYGKPEWRQIITRSWQHPKSGYVIDHLTPDNYLPYFARLRNAFPRPSTKIPQSWFIDSWEVETDHLWAKGFDRDFEKKFNYDISPYMDSIYNPRNSRYLYDYMCLISEKVINFYKNFDKNSNEAGVFSRGQVAGAPCDLISGYSCLDIPEGESMLFEPEYCVIPASAALLTGKKVVSSETFTCLYGWPHDYIRQEQVADLKLVADALFSNGINHIIWHGKPHNPKDQDTVSFYATTHVGPSGSLSGDFLRFNKYLETVSSYMKKGHSFSDIAVYLPTEDAWTAGIMPKEKQFIWAWGFYEMRYIYLPDELASYNPVWINSEFLEKGKVENGVFYVGDAKLKIIYFDSKYLDYKVIKRLADLADLGLQIVMKQIPKEPGTIFHKDYQSLIEKILASRPDIASLPRNSEPFIKGNNIPRHWCREDGDTLYVFFPDPKSDKLKFPLEYGQSLNTTVSKIPVTISFKGESYYLNLEFKPYQSLLYRLSEGKSEQIDIEFIPATPVVRQRPAGYKAPWLVK